jgi:hypothetical protein
MSEKLSKAVQVFLNPSKRFLMSILFEASESFSNSLKTFLLAHHHSRSSTTTSTAVSEAFRT